MCIICVDLIKHKMTLPEAKRAATEFMLASNSDPSAKPDAHQEELYTALIFDDLESLAEILDEVDV